MRRSTRKATLIVAKLALNAVVIAAISSFMGFSYGKKVGLRDGIVLMTQLVEAFAAKEVDGPALNSGKRRI